MPPIKLTKHAVEKLRAPDASSKQRLIWDAELKGFGVLVSGVASSKTYIAQRRLPDGRTRRVTVGSVEEIDLDKARSEAADLLYDMRHGKDPKAERRRCAAGTLRATLDEYLSANKRLAERTRKEYRKSVEQYLSKWLDMPLRDITADMVEDHHAAIAAGIAKAANGSRRGGGLNTGGAAANAAMRVVRLLWNHATERDPQLPPNPVRRLKRAWFAQVRRERLVKADDLPAFYTAVCGLPNTTQRDFVLLLLFTGLRRSEAASLRWDDIDFSGGLIRVPAARTKPGRKLDLPMSSFVRDLLIRRRAVGNDNGWVFGADSETGHVAEPGPAFDQIAQATGIRVTSHDLRRTFITIAESTDISVSALKALVNHSLGNDVTSGYIQMTTERLREPAKRVCDRIKELCKINEPEGIVKMGIVHDYAERGAL